MQLFQINQSEESSKITVNAHTASGQSHQQSIISAAHYNRIYSMSHLFYRVMVPEEFKVMDLKKRMRIMVQFNFTTQIAKEPNEPKRLKHLFTLHCGS